MFDIQKNVFISLLNLRHGVKTEFISIFSCPVSANISSLWLTFYFNFMIVCHLINFTYVFCRVIPYKLIFVFVSRKKEIFEIDMKFFNCEPNVKEKASKKLPTC